MSIPIIPKSVAGNAEIDITWATAVSTSEGGIAGRKALRMIPQRQFHLTIGPDDVQTMINIYMAANGPRFPVAVRDWSNYQFQNEELVYLSSGGFIYAQLSQTFTPTSTYSFNGFSTSESFTYPILLPDQSEVPLSIYLNGVLTAAWTLEDFGVVRLAASLASGDTITASGEYLIPACFLQDDLTIKQITGYTSAIDSFDLREILLPELQTLLASIPA
jgi:Conserved hypothetical protein 2217 (DUF2460)